MQIGNINNKTIRQEYLSHRSYIISLAKGCIEEKLKITDGYHTTEIESTLNKINRFKEFIKEIQPNNIFIYKEEITINNLHKTMNNICSDIIKIADCALNFQ